MEIRAIDTISVTAVLTLEDIERAIMEAVKQQRPSIVNAHEWNVEFQFSDDDTISGAILSATCPAPKEPVFAIDRKSS